MKLIHYAICLAIVFFIMCGKQDYSHKYSSDNEKEIMTMIKYKYGETRNIIDLENVINKMIIDKSILMKKQSTDSLTKNEKNEIINIEKITEYLIPKIEKYEKMDIRKTVLLYCLLKQYAGSSVDEIVTEKLNKNFYHNVTLVVDVLSDINKYLLSEFNNKKYLDYLFASVCHYPNELKEENQNFDLQKENKMMRSKLLNLKNNKNKNVINYLITNIYNEI